MIRWGLVAVCVMCVPMVALAGDAADIRRYLTPPEYGNAPHKYVLKMMGDGRVKCTANLVNDKIVTAKHCLNDYKNKICANDMVAEVYEFQTLAGNSVTAKLIECGGYDGTRGTLAGDWAILEPVGESNSELVTVCDNIDNDNTIVMTGFGKLKVLTSDDVQDYIHAYLRFLFDAQTGRPMGTSRDANVDELYQRGRASEKGVQEVRSPGDGAMCATDFMDNASAYGIDVDAWFDNSEPKTRDCSVAGTNGGGDMLLLHDCNAWMGDSGAGVWKDMGDGNYCFAGVLSQSKDHVGGTNSIGKGSIQFVPVTVFQSSLQNDT